MALEIERRFLVAGDGWRQHVRWSRNLQQGYLAGSADGLTLRVRSDGTGAAWLTLKYPARGIARHEFEYSIPAPDAEALLERSEVRVLKQRYGLDLPGGDWVLDVFEADHAPLVVAEVELQDAAPDQGKLLVPPWCGLEITGRPELSNAALACQPLATWPDSRRQQLLAWLGSPPDPA
jgi:CYTH domain-containing protein